MAVVSDGRAFENPKALRKKLNALKRASRRHSRKVKGSNNRKKAKHLLARMHTRIANVRKDALHKATSALVAKTKPDAERPSVLVLEDVNISGMLKNRKLSRAIADVGMYEFKRQVLYKAAFAGIQVKPRLTLGALKQDLSCVWVGERRFDTRNPGVCVRGLWHGHGSGFERRV